MQLVGSGLRALTGSSVSQNVSMFCVIIHNHGFPVNSVILNNMCKRIVAGAMYVLGQVNFKQT